MVLAPTRPSCSSAGVVVVVVVVIVLVVVVVVVVLVVAMRMPRRARQMPLRCHTRYRAARGAHRVYH